MALTPERKQKIADYIEAHPEMATEAIARHFHHSGSTIRDIRLKLRPGGQPTGPGVKSQAMPDPTPEEIEEHCKVFRERDRPENRKRPYEFVEYSGHNVGRAVVFEAKG